MKPRMAALLGVLLVSFGAAACLVDPNHACGPNMALTADNVCVCNPDAVLDPSAHGACVRCGTNQVAQAGVCACVAGFVMSPQGVCVAKPPGLADACDPAAPACPSADFPLCQATAQGGYCTKSGCAAPADCPSGFSCDTAITGGVCKRPPAGEGVPCTSPLECAAGDATFCAPILDMCLVEGCTVGGTSCSPGYLCCDLTRLGAAKNVCLPVEACP